jgi:hypothetical protein
MRMKAQIRTREVADFFPFGDLASFGARCVGVDLTRGYAFATGTSHGRVVTGAVALLKSDAGCFGWRLTNREVAALARAGFACRSWT